MSCSAGLAGTGTRPMSTLMPGTRPREASLATRASPSVPSWKRVSSCRICELWGWGLGLVEVWGVWGRGKEGAGGAGGAEDLW